MTIEKNIFELATQWKLRYPSPQGELTTEQLWDLPLTAASPTKADLDKVAKAINTELKGITEESFVSTTTNPRVPLLSTALEVVKHIIAHKQAEAKAKADSKARAEKRALLMEAYEAKQRDELVSGKSSEQLLKELEALG